MLENHFLFVKTLTDVYWTHIMTYTENNHVGLIYWNQYWMFDLMRWNRKQDNQRIQMK